MRVFGVHPIAADLLVADPNRVCIVELRDGATVDYFRIRHDWLEVGR
jgi:hypothetical protein